ncbi:glycosyltransferase family 4 protein [Acidithiobacillus ferridurans]|nr:glycosyltransferase family 4 protein [Acidithiobacillus ferridurans]
MQALAYRLRKIGGAPLHPLILEKLEEVNLTTSTDGRTPQLLFDVSELSLRDFHTGIPRVVRALLFEILHNPPTGYQVAVVRADVEGRIVYAQQFTAAFLEQPKPVEADMPVGIGPGDLFFSADLHLSFPFESLQRLRAQGLRVVFTVYDLIALQLDTMPKPLRLAFSDWFTGVLATTDAIICDSRTVADEVFSWLQMHSNIRHIPLPIGYFHLGANLEASCPTQGIDSQSATMLHKISDQPTLLMVGTIEPRKGYSQALTALEWFWAKGISINLVIVGREGWRSRALIRRLRRHPQKDRQLFWLERASDTLLLQLYRQCTALLAASYAEGFGLPLIEAAHYGLPIIARDIPIFREVARENAYYFPNGDVKALTNAIEEWFALHAIEKTPASKGIPCLTWAQSAQQALDVLLTSKWYRVWQASNNVSEND